MLRYIIFLFLAFISISSYSQTKKKPSSQKGKTSVKKKPTGKKPAIKKPTGKKPVRKPTSTVTNRTNQLKDSRRVVAPKLNGSEDSENEEEDTLGLGSFDNYEIDEIEGAKLVFFPDGSPFKEQGILNEDTITIDDNLDEIDFVETEEEIKIDSEWVKVYQDFEWMQNESTNRVNPYNFDPSEMEPVALFLVEEEKGRKSAKPLHRCQQTSDFGPRWGRFHYGVDLALSIGDSVFSTFDGLVRVVGFDRGGYGNFIVVRHYNGLETVYGHLSRTYSKIGDYVKAGDLIGFGGNTGRSTGPHLHYELRYAGKPIDPKFFYDFSNCELTKKACYITKDNFKYQQVARKVYYHKVRPGETLSKIARKYRVSVAKLRKINKLSPNAKLKAGRRIRIN
ncbi:MAG: peptidoglycan DD-metalloendopeptidase family protein [Cytophagales bacterium]